MKENKINTILRDVAQLLQTTGVSEADILKIENLQTKIENRELVISVIGQFKRGKTSLTSASGGWPAFRRGTNSWPSCSTRRSMI